MMDDKNFDLGTSNLKQYRSGAVGENNAVSAVNSSIDACQIGPQY
jgi:hypothetical protein